MCLHHRDLNTACRGRGGKSASSKCHQISDSNGDSRELGARPSELLGVDTLPLTGVFPEGGLGIERIMGQFTWQRKFHTASRLAGCL